MTGCNVNPMRVIDDGSQFDYIRQIASYEKHYRVVHIPDRFNWYNPSEMIYDLVINDAYWQRFNQDRMFDPDTSHIGIACSCHPTYDQICVFEFATNVKPKVNVTKISPAESWNGMIRDVDDVPKFITHYDGLECPAQREDGACNEVDYDTYPPDRINPGPYANIHERTTQDLAQELYHYINDVRDDPSHFETVQMAPWSEYELENWEPSGYPQLKWSDALANAARQVANTEGPCDIDGDEYGNSVAEALLRFYAYEVEGLEVVRVTSTEFMYSPGDAFEFILGHKCIDQQIFKSQKEHIGIGCSCENDHEMMCYFVTADYIRPKTVIERIPTYQKIIDYNLLSAFWDITGYSYGDTGYFDIIDNVCNFYCFFKENDIDGNDFSLHDLN